MEKRKRGRPKSLETISDKMIKLLRDMQPHTIEELIALLEDPEARYINIHPHLLRAREKLSPEKKTIICQAMGHGRFYRMIYLSDPANQDTSIS